MQINLLDHGYVEVVEHFGSDERIIEAARMSVDKGFVSWDPYDGHPKGDAGLLRYLYEHNHATPFEMAGLIIEVKAPIFVFREWHRHRTQSYNEMSARYVPLPDENWTPEIDRIIRGATQRGNRQAEGLAELNLTAIRDWLDRLQDAYRTAQTVYEEGIALGVPKEIARAPVPVARYSRMRASANLRNWLGFLTLRTAPNAQEEIRVYAEAVAECLRASFPRTMELFDEGRD